MALDTVRAVDAATPAAADAKTALLSPSMRSWARSRPAAATSMKGLRTFAQA